MSRELDLRDYFRIVRKRLWLIVLIVVLGCTLVGVYSIFVKKPVFEASTKIVVNQTGTQSVNDQLDLNQINTNIQLINTYKEVIKTPAILDRVAEEYPKFELNAEQLAKMVNVNSVNNTQVMTIVVRDTSYVKAAEIANAISAIFQEEIPSIFNVQNVSILNEAKTEPDNRPQPVEPNIVLNLAIALVVSMMLGLGLSFLLEFMDDTIKTEEDVKEFLDAPTLAMIAHISEKEIAQSKNNPKKASAKGKQGDENHAVTR